MIVDQSMAENALALELTHPLRLICLAAVPVLLGGRAAQSLIRWDGRGLRVEAAPPGAARAARPGDVRVPV